MRRSCRWLLMFLPLLCGVVISVAQKAASPPLVYKGTVGQQHVTMLLDVEGSSLNGGHYSYDGQKSEIRFTEVRVFGTTAALQDEDGNTLHLHMKSASGGGAPEWANAATLEGTLVRGNLDLPVRLTRTEPKP